MAHDQHPPANAMDYAEHERTFSLFIALCKWGSLLSLVLVLLMGAMTNTIPWLFAIAVSVITAVLIAKLF